jgi:hypothetical protein
VLGPACRSCWCACKACGTVLQADQHLAHSFSRIFCRLCGYTTHQEQPRSRVRFKRLCWTAACKMTTRALQAS